MSIRTYDRIVKAHVKQILIALTGAIGAGILFTYVLRGRPSPKLKGIVSKYLKDLEDSRAELLGLLQGYSIQARHLVPDHVLYNYALDVLEHAGAVQMLAGSEWARSGHTNARGGLEAAMDLMLLASRLADYDEYGALARVCELVEFEDIHRRRAETDVVIGLERLSEDRSPEDIVAEEGANWEKDRPGSLSLMQDSLKRVRADKRWRKHWSGLSRKDLAKEVERRSSEGRGLSDMADALYGMLSIHSHPRPRTGMRATTNEGGTLAYRNRPVDSDFPAAIAGMACQLAIRTLRQRADFKED